MAKNISFTETDVLLPPESEGEQIPEVPGLLPESHSEFTNKVRIEISGTVFIIQERSLSHFLQLYQDGFVAHSDFRNANSVTQISLKVPVLF